MVLTMCRKILLSVWLLLSGFLSKAQEANDSTWYYANHLTNYATADLVCLVRVGHTEVRDTMGAYTIQEVAFEPIACYKGKTEQRKFRAWLENHAIVWQPGTVMGLYLLEDKQVAVNKSGKEKERYYWLENSGFTIADTPFIAAISAPGYFKKMAAQYILPEISGTWAKAKLVNLKAGDNDGYSSPEARIRLEQDVPALRLRSGQVITVSLWNDPYIQPEELAARFREQGIWEVVLCKEGDQIQMPIRFMLRR